MAAAPEEPKGPVGATADARAPKPAFERLRRRADFQRAAKGRRASSALLTLQAVPRPDAETEPGPARFGLTVTRKTGGAVERNRMRRRLRAALATAALAGQPGHDYVIVARRTVLGAPFSDLVTDLAARLDEVARRPARNRSRRPKPDIPS